MKRAVILFLIMSAFSGCTKKFEIISDVDIYLDNQALIAETGGSDTLRYELAGPSLDYFFDNGGYAQLRPDDPSQMTELASGRGWFLIQVNSTESCGGSVDIYADGIHRSVRFRFLVSPKRIIYSKEVTTNSHDIWICNQDGSAQTALVASPNVNEHSPTLSSSGEMYAYAKSTGFYIMNMTGGSVYSNTTSSNPQNLQFIRDETGLTYLDDIQSGPRIMRLDPDADLATYVDYPGNTYQYYEWFVFANSLGNITKQDFVSVAAHCSTFLNNNPATGADYKMYDSHDDSGNPFLSESYPRSITYAELSPDGKYIVYSEFNTTVHRIFLVNRNDLSNPVMISPSSSNCDHPSFNATGTRIVFSSNMNGNYDLYTMNTDGTDMVQITNTPENETEPQWK